MDGADESLETRAVAFGPFTLIPSRRRLERGGVPRKGVYDNEAALNAHRNTEHFKKYQAATASMVTGRNARAMSLVAFNAKGH